MKKIVTSRINKKIFIRFFTLIIALLSAMLGGSKLTELPTEAATPASGGINATIGATAPPWTGTKLVGASANGEPTCTTGDDAAANCDVYTLTVNGVPADWVGKLISVRLNWTLPADDYDMVVRKETNGTAGMQGDGVSPAAQLDAVVGTSGNGTNTFEEVVISPSDSGVGIYYIRAIYYAVPNVATDQYQGSATVVTSAGAPPTGTCAVPTFDNYQPPVGFSRRDDAGEPSIGINWNTGNVMTMARLQANRTTFDDSTSPADPTNGATWFAKPIPLNPTGFDPIGFTDPITGRSIYGELEIVGGSTFGVISDDDLNTISNAIETGGATQGFDHQTIGGGPPNKNIAGRQPSGRYPHLVYYASQQIAYASVATSFDGGYTYQPAIPAYNLTQCNGLHGHIKVAPDGTVYLPNKGCGGKSGFAVSEDNGLTWNVRTVPNSTAGNTDPSVGIGAGGRVYFSYSGANNHPHVAVSDDRGVTWHDHFDLATLVSPGITAAVFMHAVAGDNNRAAVFFIGTSSTNTGDPVGDDSGTPFAGTWYPYMATTCDGGKSWTVTRADNDPLNPGANPVQQGVVCTNGTTCPDGTRNLLDFNELAVDARGRVVAVYADGCNPDHPCYTKPVNDPAQTTKTQNQATARLTIIRQRGGMRLFSEYDAASPSAPRAPFVNVKENAKGGNQLLWGTPDDRGASILRYRIYRGSKGEKEKLLKEVKAGVNAFADTKAKSKNNYYYHVTAVNKYGESPKIAKAFALKPKQKPKS